MNWPLPYESLVTLRRHDTAFLGKEKAADEAGEASGCGGTPGSELLSPLINSATWGGWT